MGRICSIIIACLFLITSANGASTFGNPLVDAVEFGDDSSVLQLIRNKYNPNTPGRFGSTALMRAAYHKKIKIVHHLIDAGANVNSQDIAGTTALHIAARQGHTAIVKLLINKGAVIDVMDHEGFTPLMRAVSAGRLETVKILLENHADKATKNHFGKSAQNLSQYSHNKKVRTLFNPSITEKPSPLDSKVSESSVNEATSKSKLKIGTAIKVEGELPKLIIAEKKPLDTPKIKPMPVKVEKKESIEEAKLPLRKQQDNAVVKPQVEGFYLHIAGFSDEHKALTLWNWLMIGKKFNGKKIQLVIDKQSGPILRVGYYAVIKDVFAACKQTRKDAKGIYCYATPVAMAVKRN